MREAWYVEKVAKHGVSVHWQAERQRLEEVLDDLRAAREAGDHFRFIAPSLASDEEIDLILESGAVPTFPAFVAQPSNVQSPGLRSAPIGAASPTEKSVRGVDRKAAIA